MRKIYAILPLACALTFTACDDYDDTALWEQVNSNTERIAALEEWQETTNNNIAALQQLLNTNDMITSVTPVLQGDKEVGYTITFLHSDPVTIYHGEKGDKGEDGTAGSTPQIGLTQQTDGNWYWTLNGELMQDAEGNPIRANGEDGKDGQDGEDGADGDDGSTGATGRPGTPAPTPQIKLGSTLTSGTYYGLNGNKQTEADKTAWYLSVDNGASWYRVNGEDGQSGSSGAAGDSFFNDVVQNDLYVTFTLTDGTTFQVPVYQSLKIGDGTGTLALIEAETEIKLTLPDGTTAADYSALVAQITPEGADGTYTDIDTRADDVNGWKVEGDLENAKVTVTAGSGTALLRVTLIRSDGGEVTASRIVERPDYTVSDDEKTYTVYTADGLIAWANAAVSNTSVGCILAADIDMENKVLPVVGANGNSYKGSFDGGCHTISNLTISSSGGYVGFIGIGYDNCIVQNVTFKDLSITATGRNVGGIMGQVSGNTVVKNCHVVGGTIKGTGYVGGIIGFISSKDVQVYACSSTATLEASSTIGGIVGGNSGTNNTGGGTITACYVKGSITATEPSNKIACGIAGENCGTITAAYWQADGVTVGTLKLENNIWVDDTDNSGTIQVSNDDGWNDDVVSAMNNALSTANISGYEWIKNTGNDSESRPLVIEMN